MSMKYVLTLAFGAVLSWCVAADGPYKVFGVPVDGKWTGASCKFKLKKPIGLFSTGYVYTNSVGFVHQFNFARPLADNETKDSAINELKGVERALARMFVLSSFTPHVDSNPNRYLWSEECSMTECGGWSVRLYLEKDERGNGLVAKCSIWNAKLNQSPIGDMR